MFDFLLDTKVLALLILSSSFSGGLVYFVQHRKYSRIQNQNERIRSRFARFIDDIIINAEAISNKEHINGFLFELPDWNLMRDSLCEKLREIINFEHDKQNTATRKILGLENQLEAVKTQLENNRSHSETLKTQLTTQFDTIKEKQTKINLMEQDLLQLQQMVASLSTPVTVKKTSSKKKVKEKVTNADSVTTINEIKSSLDEIQSAETIITASESDQFEYEQQNN